MYQKKKLFEIEGYGKGMGNNIFLVGGIPFSWESPFPQMRELGLLSSSNRMAYNSCEWEFILLLYPYRT